MYPELGWTLLALLVLWVLLGRVVADRRRWRFLWGLMFTAGLLWSLARFASAPPWTAEAALALTELAGVYVAATLVFHLLLRGLKLPRLVSDLTVGAGYVAVLLSLLSRVGVNVTGLIATSAVLTAVIGFSLQDLLANLAGGVVLEIERSIVEGDWIQTDHGIGQVRDVRLRHTAIETPDADTIVIPNSVVTRSSVTVLGRTADNPGGVKHRKLIPFQLRHGHSPSAVVEAVEQALAASPMEGIAPNPRPRCLVREFQPLYIEYGVLVWIERPAVELLDLSTVRTRVYYALERMGAPLVSITQPVELRQAAGQPSGGMADGMVALRRMEIFRTLSEGETQRLSAGMKKMAFAPGELILRQGDEGDSLYILTRGHVRVLLSGGNGLSEHVAMLSPGDFFGEMSLLTGERRSANVVAADQVDCFSLGKGDLNPILAAHPALVEDISGVLAARQSGLAGVREQLDEEARRHVEMESRKNLLKRIRKYFGLA